MGGAGGYEIGLSSSSSFGAQFGNFAVESGFKITTLGWAVIAGVALLGLVLFSKR